MNKEHAAKKGFVYTGISSANKTEVQTKLNGIRSIGYDAMLVTEKPSPLARGHHGPMYSVYTEKRYQINEEAKNLLRRLSTYEKAIQDIMEECQAKIKETEAARERDKQWLKDNGYFV